MKKDLPKLAAIPKYRTTLPSGKEIDYRPFLVKEERLLLMAAEDDKDQGEILGQVIEACTFGALKANSISAVDMEWIMIMLKVKAKGAMSKLALVCNNEVDGVECGKKTEVNINVEEYTVVTGDKKDLVVKLDEENGLKVKELSLKDAARIEAIESETDQAFERIYASIDTIYFGEDVYNAKDVSRESLVEFVDNMSKEQIQAIAEAMKSLPAVILPIKFVCPHCGNKETVEVRGADHFLD